MNVYLILIVKIYDKIQIYNINLLIIVVIDFVTLVLQRYSKDFIEQNELKISALRYSSLVYAVRQTFSINKMTTVVIS